MSQPDRPPHSGERPPRSGRSVGALLRDLSGEVSTLLHEESALARAELREKLDRFGSGAVELGAGGLLTFAGLLVLLASAVLGLGHWLPLWLSALVVGGVALLIGLLVLARGRSHLKSENLAPQRTLDSLRRDAELARAQAEPLRTGEAGEPPYEPPSPRSH
jgi:hypothetical protein